jgi:hypothetical protein
MLLVFVVLRFKKTQIKGYDLLITGLLEDIYMF